MPEIANEFPSDGELHAYLTGYYRPSASSKISLPNTPGGPEMAEALEYGSAHPLGGEFVERSFASHCDLL